MNDLATFAMDAHGGLERWRQLKSISARLPQGGVLWNGRATTAFSTRDQIQLSAFPLVFGGRSIYGALTGTAIDNEDTLAFSVLENIRPMIETRRLEQAADAYIRMMAGKARFRMVLTMNA